MAMGLRQWQEANEELCRESALLTALAVSGDQFAFDVKSLEVEEARLHAENARYAINMHRLRCHSRVPADLYR
jgi:hypothetical protein